MQSVIMLSAVPAVVTIKSITLSVTILNVILLSALVLNVVAPF